MKKLAMYFILVLSILAVTGCSGFMNSSYEFKEAYEVQGKVHALATQVRGADRSSQIDKVLVGERFFANCETFARTAADLLIFNGANPADVYLVKVHIPINKFTFVWDNGHRIYYDKHMIVEYGGYIIDNRFDAVLTRDDLKREYEFMHRASMNNPDVWEKI